MHQLGDITPPPSWCNAPLSGVTPLRNKLKRGTCLAGHTARPDCGARGRRQGLAGLRDDTPILCCPEGTSGTGGTAGSDCGARGRQQGLAMLRDDAPIPCWMEGASGTGGTAGSDCGAHGQRQGLAGLRDDAPIPYCLEGAGGTSWTTSPGRSARGRRQGLAGLRDRSLRSPAVWRAPVEPEGLLAPAAAPVGGGRAWPGFEIDHSEPLGSRVAISRAGRRPQASTTRQSVRAWHPRS